MTKAFTLAELIRSSGIAPYCNKIFFAAISLDLNMFVNKTRAISGMATAPATRAPSRMAV